MFSKKSIRVLVQKTDGEFKEGVNTLEFKNLPIEVKIKRNGTSSMSNIKIYGISKEHINAITNLPSLGLTQFAKLNVVVYVDDGGGEFLLYIGSMRDACPHYTEAPDVYIDIQCVAFAFQNLIGDIPPNRFDREASVPDMYRAVCASFNLSFVDLTKEKQIVQNPPSIDGENVTARLNQLKDAYKKTTWFNYNETVYIINTEQYLKSYDISPKDYIGYPTFNQTGIGLVFDKIVLFKPLSDAIRISGSELDMVNRKWNIITIEYNLSTKIGGKWEMGITCVPLWEDKNGS